MSIDSEHKPLYHTAQQDVLMKAIQLYTAVQ